MYDGDGVCCSYSTFLLQELELREKANAVLKHKVSELERKEKQEALGAVDVDRPQLPDVGTKGQSRSPLQAVLVVDVALLNLPPSGKQFVRLEC